MGCRFFQCGDQGKALPADIPEPGYDNALPFLTFGVSNDLTVPMTSHDECPDCWMYLNSLWIYNNLDRYFGNWE